MNDYSLTLKGGQKAINYVNLYPKKKMNILVFSFCNLILPNQSREEILGDLYEVSYRLKKQGKSTVIVSLIILSRGLLTAAGEWWLWYQKRCEKWEKQRSQAASQLPKYKDSVKKVGIVWFSNTERLLAEELKDVLSFRKLETVLLNIDTISGISSLSKIRDQLEDADFTIACLGSRYHHQDWSYLQVGLILGQLHNLKFMRFKRILGEHLTGIPSIDGTSREELSKLVKEVNDNSIEEARSWVELKFPQWSTRIEEALSKAEHCIGREENFLVKAVKDYLHEMSHLSSHLDQNTCLNLIILNSVMELQNQISSLESSSWMYSMPSALYPRHLIQLQQTYFARISAVALVDHDEYFWSEEVGRQIGETATRNSIRIFVFRRPEDLERNFAILLEHASRYEVRAMNYDTLTLDFSGFNKNFSIIEISGSKVLAEYVGRGPQKIVRFSAAFAPNAFPSDDEVARHENRLRAISQSAVVIPDLAGKTNDPIKVLQSMRQIRDLVFGRTLVNPVEMSTYVDPEEYDKNEEKHAYFQEMMEKMIAIFSEHRDEDLKPCRVLELGAGTGIFTKRLAHLPKVEVSAIELDCSYFKKLSQNLETYVRKGSVVLYNQDSCTFDPPGKFDYIFSSFADHHIKRSEREMYFHNIKRNLKHDGLLIVGDEFLPPYNSSDKEAWKAALKKYHHHIIEIAEKEGQTKLAALEDAALRSGLEEIGDFKLSCEEYEKVISSAGFAFKKEKIGPHGRDDLGGVYVYTVHLSIQ